LSVSVADLGEEKVDRESTTSMDGEPEVIFGPQVTIPRDRFINSSGFKTWIQGTIDLSKRSST